MACAGAIDRLLVVAAASRRSEEDGGGGVSAQQLGISYFMTVYDEREFLKGHSRSIGWRLEHVFNPSSPQAPHCEWRP